VAGQVNSLVSNNRKDQGFLLVEIRIAIQRVDMHFASGLFGLGVISDDF
jgi:hypothetical protein